MQDGPLRDALKSNSALQVENARLRAENRRMREALEDIAVYGCGMLNQPATLNEPVETWLRRRIR